MAPEQKLSRRNFVTEALAGWLFLTCLPVLYSVVKYLVPPNILDKVVEVINAGKFTDIPFNSAKIVRFNKKAIILVRTEQEQVKAFSAVCTHLGCIVEFKPDEKIFKCNCHGSQFDLTGKNIAGPAPTPLKPFRVELKDDNILVSQA
ncbi:MAG TPA: Rieske 2Fe-2S domain-containing protein [Bacteroidota bacterium]|jgi:cytochrome b6-f complex iron-sulfur subunit